MSAKLMGQVWELDLPHNQQSVLLAYADHADDDGFNAKPGIEYVAWKTGYSERQVQRIVRDLESGGLLVVASAAAGRRATVYRVVVDAGDRKDPYVARHLREEPSEPRGDNLSGRHSGHARGDISGRSADIQVSPEPEPPKEPSGPPSPPWPIPEGVLDALNAAADGKGATRPKPETVAAIVSEFPGRAHATVAADVLFWLLEGGGKARRRINVAQTFRNFLKREHVTQGPRIRSATNPDRTGPGGRGSDAEIPCVGCRRPFKPYLTDRFKSGQSVSTCDECAAGAEGKEAA